MAVRIQLPFADVGNGISPSDGATLDFFITGTSSRKDTFTNEALSVANANPVVADSDGLFSDIWIADSSRYKVVLKAKNGVQQWESDPVVGGVSADKVTTTFDTVALMVASADLKVGLIVQTAGYISKGDGGDNRYEIVAAGTGTDDGGSFIDLATHQAKGLFPVGVVNLKQFAARGDGTTDDTTAIINAVTGGFAHVHAQAGTYIFEPDGLSIPSGWSFPPIINLPDVALRFTGDGDSTIFKKGTSTSTNAATFIAAVLTTADIQLGPFLVLGTGNPGSNGAVIDGVANIGATNLTINKVNCDRTKRHGHYLTKGATGNTYHIGLVTRCNRNNLGVGVQLEGADDNIFYIDQLKDIGSNGVDLNTSQASDPFYGTIGTGDDSTDNKFFIKSIDGVGLSNQTDGGGASTFDVDDDYYGINIIGASNDNEFHVGSISKVRKDVGIIAPAADTFASSIRILSSTGNSVFVDEVRDVGETSDKFVIRMNQDCQGNTVEVGRSELVGFPLSTNDLSNCFDNSIIIKDGLGSVKLSRAGQVTGTDFKFLKATTDTQDGGTLSGWTTQFGYTVDVVNNELTKTVTTGQTNKKLSQIIECFADYLIAEFEYQSTAADAAVGINNAPFDITTLPVSSGVWKKRKILVLKSDDGFMDFAIWGSKGTAPASTSLKMRGLKFYTPDGRRLSVNNQFGRLDGVPAAGTYSVGDYVKNITPVVGQAKGFYCTVAGTPGTWVSEGNL